MQHSITERSQQMTTLHAALYARVSTDHQSDANTIASQVTALRQRITADTLSLAEEAEFIDDGYSGATLIRPALERLRDLVAAGGIDRLYVYAPDRLARKYAYQVMLVDEFNRAGVEITFLCNELGQSPERDLLLQVQGMLAEYERAQIVERCRRGKRHSANAGSASVFGHAPYGYRYVSKREGGGEARYEINFEEAQIVRQIFDWVGCERVSMGEVRRRLHGAGVPTQKGKNLWDRSTLWRILRNPAYVGLAAYGKRRNGPMLPRPRPIRGHSAQPRRARSFCQTAREDWISVPVPAIVDEDVFTAVQEQLENNQRRARQSPRHLKFVLQGLACCKRCEYAYCGAVASASRGKPRVYGYYRCTGADSYRFGGHPVCSNKPVRSDLLDQEVWREVGVLLKNPERVTEEYQRRMREQMTEVRPDNEAAISRQLERLRRGIARLIDSYAEGLIEKDEFEPRITRMKQRIEKLEEQIKEHANRAHQKSELQLVTGRIEEFAAKVKNRLAEADELTRREIICALVKRVEIDDGNVTVVFRVSPDPFALSPERGVLQDCCRRSSSSPCASPNRQRLRL